MNAIKGDECTKSAVPSPGLTEEMVDREHVSFNIENSLNKLRDKLHAKTHS